MSRWYALHTKPRAERRLGSALRHRGFDVYLPEIVARQRDGVSAKEPLFPGYIFTRIDLEMVDSAKWRWTPGLRHIVTYGEMPVAIPDEVIRLIEHKLGELNVTGKANGHPFKPGDLVRVKQGPFADVTAVFEGPVAPSERVSILLEAINRTIRLRVDAFNLEKASSQDKDGSARRPRRSRGRGRIIAY